MDPQWDKKLCNKIRGELGLSHEVAMAIVGEVAEHRQTAYLQGYNRGFNKNPDACGSPKPHDEDTISKRFYNYRQSWWFDIVVAYRSNKFRVVIERNAFNDQSLMCGYGLDLGALEFSDKTSVRGSRQSDQTRGGIAQCPSH